MFNGLSLAVATLSGIEVARMTRIQIFQTNHRSPFNQLAKVISLQIIIKLYNLQKARRIKRHDKLRCADGA